MKRLLTAALLLFLLAGCASSRPAMRHYLLTPAVQAPPVPATLGQRVTVIGPLQLPGYLNRPQLMIRLPGGELALREQHRWAEPLDALLTRALAENLALLTGSQRILTFPVAGRIEADQRVVGRVIRFDADGGGLAVLEVQWSVVDAAGRTLLPVRSAVYRQQATDADEPALVVALGQTLGQFARELAADLAALAAND